MIEYKDSKIDWLGLIPANWAVMPNKYLMHKIKILCHEYGGEDILSLSVNGVHVRDLDAGGKMPTSFNGYQRIYSGNLLMCLFDMDVTPRCIGIIKQDGLTSPAYSQFETKEIADANYYYYYYLMLDYDKTLVHLAKNLRHSLTESDLGTTPTLVPPIEDQKLIANFLDKKCYEIDSIINDIDKEIQLLERYKQSLITEAVTKGIDDNVVMKDSGIEWIGQIPLSWKVIQSKYCFSAHKRIVGNRQDSYDRLSLTMQGVVRRSKDDVNGLQPDSFYSYQILNSGELVFKLIDLQNVHTSRVGLSPYTGIVSPAYIILSPKSMVYPSYAEKYFLSLWHRQIFNHLGDEGVRSSLNVADLLNLPFICPPYETQRSIADYLSEKCSEIDLIIEGKKKHIETLNEYKKSLIFEYVTGKKEVCNVRMFEFDE